MGVRDRLSTWAHCTPLPSILLANIQALENKLDDLMARIKYQRDITDFNTLCHTQTWLTPSVPDHAIQPAEFLSVQHMDRTGDSGKSWEEEVCLMVNTNWCHSRNILFAQLGGPDQQMPPILSYPAVHLRHLLHSTTGGHGHYSV